MSYDVIIAGAGFAGLSVAYHTKLGNKLVLEKEKSFKQRSTCGTPVHVLKEIGCKQAILKSFDRIIFHSNSKECKLKLFYPYCTFDFYKFCNLMTKQLKNTKIIFGTKVRGLRENEVVGDKKTWKTKYIVDCSGHDAVIASSLVKNYFDRSRFAMGIETETNYSDDAIHFYYYPDDKTVGWIFPVSDCISRIGVASYTGMITIQKLKNFLKEFKVKVGRGVHGGIIPLYGLRKPVVGNVFVVGDAGGQVLPLTAEGIRKAILNGKLCGELISDVILGKLSLEEALKKYEESVMKSYELYSSLIKIQERLLTRKGSIHRIFGIVNHLPQRAIKRLEELYIFENVDKSISNIGIKFLQKLL